MSADRAGSDAHLGLGRVHRFLIGQEWLYLKLSFKVAVAIAISLAILQARKVATLLTTLGYLTNIFTILYAPDKPRIVILENTLLAGLLIGFAAPFCMLIFLCAHAVRDTSIYPQEALRYIRDPSPAAFYQGRPAAVCAVWLFILSWIANVAKTVFFTQIFSITGVLIFAGVIALEGFLFPTWAQFYGLLKQLLYGVYIAQALTLAVGLIIFPHNAREPYFEATSKYLAAADALMSGNMQHFANLRTHIRNADEKERTPSHDSSEDSRQKKGKKGKKDKKPEPSPLEKLRGLRAGFVASINVVQTTKAVAKREIAIGHLGGADLSKMHEFGLSLVVPLLGCNLWSHIADILRETRQRQHDGEDREAASLLHAIGGAQPSLEERERFMTLLDTHLGPRILALSQACSEAIEHIQKGLHLGVYKRPPFWFRPFTRNISKFTEEDLAFSDDFERRIQLFWGKRHARTRDTSASRLHLLTLYMEATMHAAALRLLEYARWVDELQREGTMERTHLIVPQSKSFKKAFVRGLGKWTGQAESKHKTDAYASTDGVGGTAFDAARPELVNHLLRPARSPLEPYNVPLVKPVGAVKRFLESELSGFGFRGAIAMLAVSLPAYFPDSVYTFTRYRFLWISFTVFLGLQPIVGRAMFVSIFRIIGTIIGGVLGLLAVEIGRVPAGIIPVFFVFAWPQWYFVVKNRAIFTLPVLLSLITMVLIVGYELLAAKLGQSVLTRSGQPYLSAPHLMGWRILLTVAGVVAALIFTIFPMMPTARDAIRDITAKWLHASLDKFSLTAVRMLEVADASDAMHAGQSSNTSNDTIDEAMRQVTMQMLQLSQNAHMFLPMTKLEPSMHGKFPLAKWTRLVTVLDNLVVASAVSSNLLRKIAEDGREGATPKQRLRRQILLGNGPTTHAGSKYFRTVNVIFYCLAEAIGQYRPLPPGLPSPMRAHIEAQDAIGQRVRERIADFGDDPLNDLTFDDTSSDPEKADGEAAVEATRTATGATIRAGREGAHEDVTTYFGAYVLSAAVFAQYLEETIDCVVDLTGKSGFAEYFEARSKGADGVARAGAGFGTATDTVKRD